jgi:hypothetical protein
VQLTHGKARMILEVAADQVMRIAESAIAEPVGDQQEAGGLYSSTANNEEIGLDFKFTPSKRSSQG